MNFDTSRGLISVGMRSLWLGCCSLGCCLLGYCLLLGAGMSFSVALGPQAWGQDTAVLEDPSKTETENSSTAVEAEGNSDASDASAAQAPDFVRVFKPGGVPKALQTAVATYRKPGEADGVEVVLIGAVHIGEPAYYRELNELFQRFDALLYELVAEPGAGVPDPKDRGVSPISTIQVGMKETLQLTFQLDEVDYDAKNFVHADMTPQEFFDTMDARKEGVLQMFFRSLGSGIAMQSAGKGGDVGLLAALVSSDRPKGLRRAFAEQMQMMDGQMAALTGEDGKSTLITERNAKAFQVLDREIKAGKKKLGIFYGAGHLKDMHQRLIDNYGMEQVEVRWLDAWEL
ncbi:MAG: hypothetical protein R3C09_03570 [Pirellulaceae bacterium]